ncbi:helix-turn-helix domain-containing protein [Teredinibacter turnerae]|uniref:helix-turn-helix domain-containing protein n=1 Tax=Teredinibacter turnerae TaxID=2426 RepID=UPI000376ADC7|nr:helix-turn-helix transcriptional regulator [Teredinibacter turnerae]
MDASLDTQTYALLLASLGLLTLSLPLLLLDTAERLVRLPLAVFLFCSTFANALPALIEIYPSLDIYALCLFLPLECTAPASLWLYSKALTSPTPYAPAKKDMWHGIPVVFACLLAISLGLLPTETLVLLTQSDAQGLGGWPLILIIGVFLLMISWPILGSAYAVRIALSLVSYRATLKNQFANNERRELYWLSWTVTLLALTWALALVYAIPLLLGQALPLPTYYIALCHFGLLWVFSIFGIRQQAGFASRYLDKSSIATEVDVVKDRYEKSGLQLVEMERIAAKIRDSMQVDKLYLDSTLSLRTLAKHIATPSNYLSQTLNVHMQTTFFDYINRLRVEHALPEVLSGEKTVLDIAMDNGFNARSSFYKAFKEVTGQNPSDYRKSHTA